LPSPRTKRLGTPNIKRFRGLLIRHCYDLLSCSPPFTGGFYFRAFDGSVTLPVAGYNYGGNWTIPPAGFSPAGSAASVAALVPRFYCSILPNMSPSMTPGSRIAAYIQFLRDAHLPSPKQYRLGTPDVNRFRGLLVHPCYDLLSCSPPNWRLLLPGFQWFGHPPHCRI